MINVSIEGNTGWPPEGEFDDERYAVAEVAAQEQITNALEKVIEAGARQDNVEELLANALTDAGVEG
jgi:predicted outer membrane protein